MSILGLDLNDAALTGVAEGELLFREPGYALAPDGTLLFGLAALRQARRFPRRVQNRYWHDLSDEPLTASLGRAHSSADLVHEHLAEIWEHWGRDAVAFAIPGHWTPMQLGLLLGIARELDITVAGLVDATVAATRREYPDHELVAVEASLHETVISEMNQHPAAEVHARHSLPGFGVDALERKCVEYFAQSFLQAERFDPLHDAASEQQLHDQLYVWLEALGRDPHWTATLDVGGRRFHAPLDRARLAAELNQFMQPVVQQLRALLPANRQLAIQVGATLEPFPGPVDTLAALPGTDVFVLEPGAASDSSTSSGGCAASAPNPLRGVVFLVMLAASCAWVVHRRRRPARRASPAAKSPAT